MARILIVAGGCRGRRLAREMAGAGHAVRVSTRSEARRAEIESSGAECWIGSPDRIATLRPALENATLACWLLGSARGSAPELRALHGSRLEAFVHQLIDTTVRGFIYEARGARAACSPDLLAGGRVAWTLAKHNRIPVRTLTTDPGDVQAWLAEARGAIGALLHPSGFGHD
jgi:hypothetical protein